MTLDEAKAWLSQLDEAVAAGKVHQMQAWEDVFAEMEHGDHDAETETLFYNYTRT